MDRLRQAIEFTDREDDGWVLWSYQPGHQAAIYDAAKSVLDAPRYWWCEVMGEAIAIGETTRKVCAPMTDDYHDHFRCGWRLLVEEPADE